MTIRNPIEWSADSLASTAQAARSALRNARVEQMTVPPKIQPITISDLDAVVREGWNDFVSNRTDVIFICFIYPLAGLIVSRLALNSNLLPFLFPFVSGFALVGPFAAAGLYEMSRRREAGHPGAWREAFGVFRSPSIGAIVALALMMTGLFLLWLAVAMGIYHLTLGPEMPASTAAFVGDVIGTSRGWALILLGGGVGFLFALLALSVSVISFPLLLDRRVTISTAVATSVRAVLMNPVPMLAWGFIVAASLLIGALPALLGLIVVMPVLGHATWHLYRRVVG